MSKRNDFIFFDTSAYNAQVVIAGGRLKLPYSLLWYTWAAIAALLVVWGVFVMITMPYHGGEQPRYIYYYRLEGFMPFVWQGVITVAGLGLWLLVRLGAWWKDTIKAAL